MSSKEKLKIFYCKKILLKIVAFLISKPKFFQDEICCVYSM